MRKVTYFQLPQETEMPITPNNTEQTPGNTHYISAMFRYVSDVHKRTTRQTCNKDLYIPSKARLNVFRNTLRYSGAHIWNNLPAKVKNVSSVEMFKTSYLNMYFS